MLIPRGLSHLLRAEAGGGRLLTLWTPGGLEQMFVELSRLSLDALRDPEIRKELASRFESIPVQAAARAPRPLAPSGERAHGRSATARFMP